MVGVEITVARWVNASSVREAQLLGQVGGLVS